MLIHPNWPAPTWVKAYTTTRRFWNHPIITPAAKLELKNRLHLPHHPIWLHQTHSSRIIEALPENSEQQADASFSTQLKQICLVMTADCLPILLCNQQGTRVAAIHAGWRGLAYHIIEHTLEALQVPADELLIWLGPAIGPQKFVVGSDVYHAFTHQHPETAIAFTWHNKGKWLADLYQLAQIKLHQQHISHIYGGQFCTYSQEDLFFSYRRDKNQTGRMASLIWLDE